MGANAIWVLPIVGLLSSIKYRAIVSLDGGGAIGRGVVARLLVEEETKPPEEAAISDLGLGLRGELKSARRPLRCGVDGVSRPDGGRSEVGRVLGPAALS